MMDFKVILRKLGLKKGNFKEILRNLNLDGGDFKEILRFREERR